MKNEPYEFIPTINTKDVKIALCVSRFNDTITNQLAQDAHATLVQFGVPRENIAIFQVPGAFEIPLTAKLLSQAKVWHAVICLGAVIRGETPHFEYVSSQVADGCAKTSYESEIPIIFGVLTTNNYEEAAARTFGKVGKKGIESAQNALEMIQLLKQIRSR
jgi:6,7-dimethyl-8-ribityllumazine synthase